MDEGDTRVPSPPPLSPPLSPPPLVSAPLTPLIVQYAAECGLDVSVGRAWILCSSWGSWLTLISNSRNSTGYLVLPGFFGFWKFPGK